MSRFNSPQKQWFDKVELKKETDNIRRSLFLRYQFRSFSSYDLSTLLERKATAEDWPAAFTQTVREWACDSELIIQQVGSSFFKFDSKKKAKIKKLINLEKLYKRNKAKLNNGVSKVVEKLQTVPASKSINAEDLVALIDSICAVNKLDGELRDVTIYLFFANYVEVTHASSCRLKLKR